MTSLLRSTGFKTPQAMKRCKSFFGMTLAERREFAGRRANASAQGGHAKDVGLFWPIPQSHFLNADPSRVLRIGCRASRRDRQTSPTMPFHPIHQPQVLQHARVCTAFVSAHAQFIIPTHAKPQSNGPSNLRRSPVFVVSLPSTEAILPNGHHPPHAACQGHSHTDSV